MDRPILLMESVKGSFCEWDGGILGPVLVGCGPLSLLFTSTQEQQLTGTLLVEGV
jgi:hypothetical protein